MSLLNFEAFEAFDAKCAKTLNEYGSPLKNRPETEQAPAEKPELTEDALHSSAEWVTKRVLQDMDALLATG